MSGNHPREFKKRSQLIVGARDEPLPVIAMRVCNPDRFPFAIHSCNTAPTPSGFAEIVTDDFPIFYLASSVAGFEKSRLVEL
jgi:hypothetical protein